MKWHILYHAVADIVIICGFYLFDVSAYKYSHTIISQSYAKKSQRRTSAMDKYISIVERKLHNEATNPPLKIPKTTL